MAPADRTHGGGRPATVRVIDVARDAGVSPGTVSNVYNRPHVVREELRLRVLDSAAKLGFAGADPTARSLRSGRTHALGIVLRERLAYAFEDLATVQLLQGVSDAADPHELALTILPAPPERGQTSGSGVRNAAVDGLILYSLTDDDPLVEAAHRRRLPIVVVDAPAPPPDGAHFVGVDDWAIGRTAADHLLDLGHRRLGVISLRLSATDRPGLARLDTQARSTSAVARARLGGAAEVAAAARLDWEDVPVVQAQDSTRADGRAAARVLLDHNPGLTAVLAFSDALALGARDTARERGLTVPDDLSILGVDDTAADSEQLTTIHQPHRDKGRRAAALLIQSLHHPDRPSTSQLLPARLVVRASTSPPRAGG